MEVPTSHDAICLELDGLEDWAATFEPLKHIDCLFPNEVQALTNLAMIKIRPFESFKPTGIQGQLDHVIERLKGLQEGPLGSIKGCVSQLEKIIRGRRDAVAKEQEKAKIIPEKVEEIVPFSFQFKPKSRNKFGFPSPEEVRILVSDVRRPIEYAYRFPERIYAADFARSLGGTSNGFQRVGSIHDTVSLIVERDQIAFDIGNHRSQDFGFARRAVETMRFMRDPNILFLSLQPTPGLGIPEQWCIKFQEKADANAVAARLALLAIGLI